MKSHMGYRWGYYLLGLLILALGIALNTKPGLGVSPIISVAYSTSTILGLNFGNVTFLLYSIFVLVELILHTIQSRRKHWEKGRLPKTLLADLLQLPLSLCFTRFLNLFSDTIPNFAEDFPNSPLGSMPVRIAVLLVAIALTGIGAWMSLAMRIVPNPGDGIVQALADTFGISVGLTKNCFDAFNITLTFCIGLLSGNFLLGIGLGTVFAVIGVGRVVALSQHVIGKRILPQAGLVVSG